MPAMPTMNPAGTEIIIEETRIEKLHRRVKEKGFSIIPYRVYFSERNFVKVEIALAQGKKAYDKRQSIKEKDNKRDMDRLKKIRL